MERDDEVQLTLPLAPWTRPLARAVGADLARQLRRPVDEPPAVAAALDEVWSTAADGGPGAVVRLTYRVVGAGLVVESEVLP